MSTTATRRPYLEAYRTAQEFGRLFNGTFDRWWFAGSLRRRRATIGDVDHVVIPKWVANPEALIAGQPVNAVRLQAEKLCHDGIVMLNRDANGRTRCGDRLISLADEAGQVHELHMCDEDNWGCIYLIRTGPNEFSRMMVTRLRAYGYRQHKSRLCLEIRQSGRPPEYPPVPCPCEIDFFKAAGFNGVILPEKRR